MRLFGIYGAGGCGRGILPLVRLRLGRGEEAVFIDDDRAGTTVNGARVIAFETFAALDVDRAICLAIGSASVRRALDQRCLDANLRFFSPQALERVAMDDVCIGEGALLSPYTTLASNIRIGRHFHLNLYSYVEHDCLIGDFVTFAPSVRCNGNIRIGDGAFIGAGAVLRQGLTIGEGATIGMGAVVTKDIPAGETWVGNPARAISRGGEIRRS